MTNPNTAETPVTTEVNTKPETTKPTLSLEKGPKVDVYNLNVVVPAAPAGTLFTLNNAEVVVRKAINALGVEFTSLKIKLKESYDALTNASLHAKDPNPNKTYQVVHFVSRDLSVKVLPGTVVLKNYRGIIEGSRGVVAISYITPRALPDGTYSHSCSTNLILAETINFNTASSGSNTVSLDFDNTGEEL